MRFVDVVVGAVVAETATTLLVAIFFKPSSALQSWYRELGLSAIVMDLLTLAVGTQLGIWLAGVDAPLWRTLLCVLAVQITHDLLFGVAISKVHGGGRVFDFFREYARAKGARILVDDAFMMGATTLVALSVCAWSADAKFVVAAAALYVNLLAVSALTAQNNSKQMAAR